MSRLEPAHKPSPVVKAKKPLSIYQEKTRLKLEEVPGKYLYHPGDYRVIANDAQDPTKPRSCYQCCGNTDPNSPGCRYYIENTPMSRKLHEKMKKKKKDEYSNGYLKNAVENKRLFCCSLYLLSALILVLFTYLLSPHYSAWSLSLFFLSGLVQACEGLRLLFIEWMEEDFPQNTFFFKWSLYFQKIGEALMVFLIFIRFHLSIKFFHLDAVGFLSVSICLVFALSFYVENDIFVYSLFNLGIVCMLSGEFSWGAIHVMLGLVLFPGADFIPLWMSELLSLQIWVLFYLLLATPTWANSVPAVNPNNVPITFNPISVTIRLPNPPT